MASAKRPRRELTIRPAYDFSTILPEGDPLARNWGRHSCELHFTLQSAGRALDLTFITSMGRNLPGSKWPESHRDLEWGPDTYVATLSWHRKSRSASAHECHLLGRCTYHSTSCPGNAYSLGLLLGGSAWVWEQLDKEWDWWLAGETRQDPVAPPHQPLPKSAF